MQRPRVIWRFAIEQCSCHKQSQTKEFARIGAISKTDSFICGATHIASAYHSVCDHESSIAIGLVQVDMAIKQTWNRIQVSTINNCCAGFDNAVKVGHGNHSVASDHDGLPRKSLAFHDIDDIDWRYNHRPCWFVQGACHEDRGDRKGEQHS